MRTTSWTIVALVALLASASTAVAQTPARRLTTIDALRRFPGYYHLQNVLLRGEFVEAAQGVQFRANERDIDVLLDDGVRTTDGTVELRAQLIDVGRLEPGDPRLASYSAGKEPERWPRPGEELLLKVTAVRSAESNPTATVRGLALEPWRYEGQTVTLVGQFRGRNLFGDLPGAPAKSKYDFVLRSGDGAIWVTGLQPKGRGFDLNVDARVDTNRWLEITGIVRRERSLVTIEASKLTATTARAEAVAEELPTPAPPPAPVEVVFSSPSDGEQDVPTGALVRIQFSRGLNVASIASGFSVTYVGEGASDPIAVRVTYDFATRSVVIRCDQPLTALRSVKVETRETLKGFDGAPITPWSLTFSTGG